MCRNTELFAIIFGKSEQISQQFPNQLFYSAGITVKQRAQVRETKTQSLSLFESKPSAGIDRFPPNPQN